MELDYQKTFLKKIIFKENSNLALPIMESHHYKLLYFQNIVCYLVKIIFTIIFIVCYDPDGGGKYL